MIYLDSDVLVNFFVEQHVEKHTQSDQIFQDFAKRNLLFTSFLVLQETTFVLAKLNVAPSQIVLKIESLLALKPYAYQAREYQRALALAEKVGFQNINDCLHTAIAEVFCTELITYNRSDFAKIQNYTSLKITIL